ncbi:hypothetical protein [Ilumatobacter nonamiensis]|uniref:hypothetical protein n=1 Tax=Ilumatobacter nonamiensis TaxID=467093 RepID=UPI0011D1B4E2|nr:hypothetical protein [Ilumatobacter nonamiensis]
MPDRPPMPRDAGDDDPTPARGVDRHSRSAEPEDGFDEVEPNFLVRRALVVGGIVLAIAVVAVVVGQIIGGDDSSSGSTAEAAEWDAIVVLDEDEIRLLDPGSGDELDAYEASADLLDAQSLVAGNVLVTMTDSGVIVQTDLSDDSQRRGRSGPDETLVISPDNPSIAIAGNDLGGDVTIIDTRDRSVVSVADAAGLDDPLIFTGDVLVNPSGTHVAVPVPTAFQSVVIDLAEGTAQARSGRVIALDDDRLVTEQPAGSESELEFYDLSGERLGSADIPAPQATLLRDDGRILAVSETGVVSTVDADGSVDDVATLTDPDERAVEITGGARAADGDRLIAVGSRNTYVLDPDGEQLAVVRGGPPARLNGAAQCVVVSPPSSSTAPTTAIDLATGATLAEIEGGFPTGDSYDGCTVAFQGTDPQLLSEGELVDVDADSIVAVAPDGSGYVVLDGRDSEYVELGDDPLEIADGPSVIHFARRG